MLIIMKNNESYRERGILGIYIEELRRNKIISEEEERDVARLYRETRDLRYRDRLVQGHLPFVISIAKKYLWLGQPLEDMINDGNLGIIKAAELYDERRGNRFLTYAVWWIRQSILSGIMKNSRTVRIPVYQINDMIKLKKAKTEIEMYDGDYKLSDIADKLGMSEEEVKRIQEAEQEYVYFDDHGSGEVPLEEKLTDPNAERIDQKVLDGMDSYVIKKAIGHLSDREIMILTLYFGLNGEDPSTLEKIGKRLGLTRERIRQIKEKSINRLRKDKFKAYFKDLL